ncbi:MAG TPA: SDR family NAD(P)-dependent oxidoreductase [Myxococcales bacterium]|jgi:NAD(P)-dependent dehydrogenase (short-subunit alcohol dehydrogenase family)
MPDLVLTGASRGIGRALALALAPRGDRLLLVARDGARLSGVVEEVKARGGRAEAVPGDLGSVAAARELGGRLAQAIGPGTTLVHNAGLWPTRREIGGDGLEAAFLVNHLAPLAMQEPLLESGKLSRILVVSAGLIALGRFDADRTPTGADFSTWRTYCSTKLAFAVALRDVSAAHPELDVVVLHPGVVRTDLGARGGALGWLLSRLKRGLESPEDCAARLARILERPRWSPPGQARWLVEDEERPWPKVAESGKTRQAVREATQKHMPPTVPRR